MSSESFELATETYGRGVCLRGIFFAGITTRTDCNVITHKQCCIFDPQKHLANEIKEMCVFIGIRQAETYWSSPDPVLLVCWICYCKRNIEILPFFLLKEHIHTMMHSQCTKKKGNEMWNCLQSNNVFVLHKVKVLFKNVQTKCVLTGKTLNTGIRFVSE